MDEVQFVEAVREMRSLQKEWQYSTFQSKGAIARAKAERLVDEFLKNMGFDSAKLQGFEYE